MVKGPGLPTLSPTWAGPLAVQVPWLTLRRKGQDPPDALGCVLATAVHPPLHASSRYLLSIFFILISQGMKMTTKLQAKRANFLQSYTGEAVVRNPLIHNLGNGVLGRGKDPIHTHRTLNYGFSGH